MKCIKIGGGNAYFKKSGECKELNIETQELKTLNSSFQSNPKTLNQSFNPPIALALL